MIRAILILLLLMPLTLQAQLAPFGAWQSGAPANPALSWDSTLVLYMASSITGKVDGDTLYRWPNSATRTGAASDGYQLTASLKPIYRDTAGVARVVFDGIDDVMGAASVSYPLDVPATILAVFKVHTTQVAANTPVFGTGAATNTHRLQIRNNVTIDPLQIYAGTNTNMGKTTVLDSVYAVVALLNGASSTMTNRGIFFAGADVGSNTSLASVIIGGMAGGYYELAYVHREITAGERAAWLDYVTKKYGVPLP